MKFPESMLRELVATSLTAEELGDLLTMAGFELEGIEVVEGESVLDIKVVSNRGDGLSVLGLAREVLAKDPSSKPTELYARSASHFSDAPEASLWSTEGLVSVECPECTRYACFIVEAVKNGSAPEWVQKRIRQAGWRPISLLVDLTNYVMLEQGQPLHAFDLHLLREERIVVRHARAGEKMTTLDGVEHELRAGQMMICDAERPVAAAGIMGGLETEVSAGTTRTLLESAHFLNTSVRRTRKQLGLSTEASYRFERSVDPEGVVSALHRLLELLRAAQPSVVVKAFADVYAAVPAPPAIALSPSRASRLLGMEISSEEAKGYLERLGFLVTGSGDALNVAAPSWRPDLVREEDLVEELGRVHGYEKIPAILPQGTTTQGGVTGFEAFVDRAREECVRLGLQQTISHSLRDLHALEPLLPEGPWQRVGPRNPNSPDMAHLRSTVIASVADAAKRNGGKDVQLFEIGRTFLQHANSGYHERIKLGILLTGAEGQADWLVKEPGTASFFTLKAIVERVVSLAPLTAYEWRAPSEVQIDPRFHPTRQAALLHVEGDWFGEIGQIHPDVAETAGLPADTFLAELDLETIYRLIEVDRGYQDSDSNIRVVSRHPSVRRDIAILADVATPYSALEKGIQAAVGDVLERMWLFDVYTGQGIPEGKHSLGIALQLRKSDSTFTDEEANQVRERAVRAIESLGATTR
jgi:phenylalanyl-tRNA synthetase beta chain